MKTTKSKITGNTGKARNVSAQEQKQAYEWASLDRPAHTGTHTPNDGAYEQDQLLEQDLLDDKEARTSMTTTHQEPSTPGAQQAAFAVLYRLVKGSKVYGRTMEYPESSASKHVLVGIPEALDALMWAIHGEPERWQYACLCEMCTLRYAEHFAKEAGNELSIWCCTPCYQHLKTEGRPKEDSDA